MPRHILRVPNDFIEVVSGAAKSLNGKTVSMTTIGKYYCFVCDYDNTEMPAARVKNSWLEEIPEPMSAFKHYDLDTGWGSMDNTHSLRKDAWNAAIDAVIETMPTDISKGTFSFIKELKED